MKLSDVLNIQMDWQDLPPITDLEIEVRCDQCGREQALAECQTEQTDEGLEYRCASCPDLIVIVSDFVEGTVAWQGRGMRLGAWVVRNVVDLRFRGTLIPASPNAPIKK